MKTKRTSNIERRRANLRILKIRYQENAAEAARVGERVYDLEERLLEYAAVIIRLIEKLPKTQAGNHVAGQLLRSATSPLLNNGEAESAESPADFVHKLKVCLKELRETSRWLRFFWR